MDNYQNFIDKNTSSDENISHDDKQMALFCHLSALSGFVIPLGLIIGPIILWQINKDKSAYVDYHGKEALNFGISLLLYGIVAFLAVFIIVGFFLLFALGLFWLICVIIASIKANEGVYYRYPFCIRFIS